MAEGVIPVKELENLNKPPIGNTELSLQKAHFRPLYLPPPYQDAIESGRIILRDGSTAVVRVAKSSDIQAIKIFFTQLSPESRYRRFFSMALPADQLIEALCDSSDPSKQLTFLVARTVSGAASVIATGSYAAETEQVAEVAFAVDDEFQGLGLGTLLLERLAIVATHHGITRFRAVTHTDNLPMVDIFRHSGFQMQEKQDHGYLEVDFSVDPTEASVARSEFLDRVFTVASIRPFFYPKSVAVVGASRDPSSIGYRVLESLVMNRFQGPVYPVNPQSAVVGSIRAYPSVKDIPDPFDLAIIVVPRQHVLGVVDECAVRGVRAVVVISAGFAESGEEGKALQKQLLDKIHGHGMRMIGPNCLGIVNTDPSVQLNGSFSPVYPPVGAVSMLSQSGALGIAILGLAKQRRLGLSDFVSIGNKADVSGNDLIQYWEQDPRTKVMLLYLESFGNPRRFSRIARRISLSKPIVAVKGGRTTAGRRAAGSHTAALAANDIAVDMLFKQTGVIRAETLEDMFELAACLNSQPLPQGNRVAIITNAGGPGILCADACETGGLKVVELTESTKAKLSKFLPDTASVSNPIDMIASATSDHYQQAISTLLSTKEVDALLILYIPLGVANTPAILEGIASGIRQGRKAGGDGKPVLACVMGNDGPVPSVQVDEEQIPTYSFPEAAARVLSRISDYSNWRAQPPGMFIDFDDIDLKLAQQTCQKALSQRGSGWLTSDETRTVLTAFGLPVPGGGVAKTADEAIRIAREVGFPVAVKLSSHKIVHKTEYGAVILNLKDDSAVREAFNSIRNKMEQSGELDAMDGVLVQPMLKGGVEVMIGVAEDPAFGPLIAFGLGGIHVEILRDVSFRVAPITDRDAREMVREIKGQRLLYGYRGHPSADIDTIEEVLLRISLLVESVPEIDELDLNPVFAFPPGQGCKIVDARIKVEVPVKDT